MRGPGRVVLAAEAELVVEVTSQRNARHDRVSKAAACATAGVPLHLLIDRWAPGSPTVTLYGEPADGVYRTLHTGRFGEPVTLPEPFGLSLSTADFPTDRPGASAGPMSCPGGHGLPHVDAAEIPVVRAPAGPVTREEVARLCDDVRALLEATGARVVVCDVAPVVRPGLGTVELLARLRLTARRAGGRIALRNPAPALRALLDLVGLPFELEGQTEQREPARDVQEAVVPGDPPG